MRSILKWFFWLVTLVIVGWGVWILFFSYASCDSWDCFNEHLKACDKVKFIGGTDMIFEYTIHGVSGGGCEVDVQLLQGELDNQDSIRLERQVMTCILPRGVIVIPESNIGRCHGLLKEGLQDLVIEKLHTYLVQNLGTLNLEMVDLPTVG